jgi:hypothetical protein
MKMTGKGFGRKRWWPDLWYYAGIHLEGPRKTVKTSISIAGLRAEIRTQDLSNSKQER